MAYKAGNLFGAFMATLGIFAPSFFILVLLIPYHDHLPYILLDGGILSIIFWGFLK